MTIRLLILQEAWSSQPLGILLVVVVGECNSWPVGWSIGHCGHHDGDLRLDPSGLRRTRGQITDGVCRRRRRVNDDGGDTGVSGGTAQDEEEEEEEVSSGI